jgi:DMSO/TMAO reductase YedYZ molybdopterin-dependent catalytic subunit
MRQWKYAAIILMLALLATIAGCTSSSPPTSSPTAADSGLKAGLPDSMDYQISVTGGQNTVTLTYKDLKAMDFTEIKNASTVNSAGTVTTGSYAGVPMMAIVNKAGLPQGNVSFKISAPDGYTKLYSMDQMQSSILGLKVNDTAMTNDINDKGKSIRMIVPGETNDMWMKMPIKIEITAA